MTNVARGSINASVSDKIDNDTLGVLIAAGGAAVQYNSPMGDDRASQIAMTIATAADKVERAWPRPRIVDLGCGRGALLRSIVAASESADGLGIDIKPEVISDARAATKLACLADLVQFEQADASTWSGAVDAAMCIGASHVFGGSAALLARIGALGPSCAVVGCAVWDGEPDEWCLSQFGELPAGLSQIETEVDRARWSIDDASMSTLDEWDAFEHAWTAGVLGLGTDVAARFANERAEAYLRYRGVLGFAWLTLSARAEVGPR